MKLTSAAISALKTNGKPMHVLWDSKTTGLGVRVYPSGRKTFVAGFRPGGKWKIKTLGPVDRLSLAEARKRVETLTNSGSPCDLTLEAFWLTYLEQYAKLHRSSWRDDEGRMRLHVLPTLGAKPLDKIRPLHVIEIHKKVSQISPIGANRVIELLKAIFNKAIEWEVFEGKNPVLMVKKNDESFRERFLLPEEAPKLFAALEAESNHYAVNAIKLLIYTGLRKNEVLKRKWTDLIPNISEPGSFVLVVPITKNGRSHVVPLSTQAIKAIQACRKVEGNPYIFVGAKRGTHLINLLKVWNRITLTAEIEDLRIHDLRHTVITWMATLGIEDDAGMQTTGHRTKQAYRRYKHLLSVVRSNNLQRVSDAITLASNLA